MVGVVGLQPDVRPGPVAAPSADPALSVQRRRSLPATARAALVRKRQVVQDAEHLLPVDPLNPLTMHGASAEKHLQSGMAGSRKPSLWSISPQYTREIVTPNLCILQVVYTFVSGVLDEKLVQHAHYILRDCPKRSNS
ncbi:hypothetical protein MTO96_021278 [Rhipicephalus appendiculatus]